MQSAGLKPMPAVALLHSGIPIIATFYPQPTTNASNGRAALRRTARHVRTIFSRSASPKDRKLVDLFRDKIHSLHYAVATEKVYCLRLVELLRFPLQKWYFRP